MPDKRVHQLGFNAERAGCNKSHQVHQWFTPSTTMCNLDDDWLALLCSANRKLPSWQAETRARGKTRGLPTSSATACRCLAILGEAPSLHEKGQPRGLYPTSERCLCAVDA